MSVDTPRINLTENYSISRIIKGGWQLAGGHGNVEADHAIEDMRAFVEAGITTFDCADIYKGVEKLIGRFLKKYNVSIRSGNLPAVQIHTKCVPDLPNLRNHKKTDTEAIIDRSLKRIGVDRLDLVQMHWWDFSIPGYLDFGHHLMEMVKQGKIRYLGITNTDASHLKEFVDAEVKLLSNQVQFSLLDRRPESDLSSLCEKHKISLLCYGVIAGGLLSDRYLNKKEPTEPFENRSLIKYKLISDDFGGWHLHQKLLVALKVIADKHGVGIAEVAGKFILDKPLVAGVIIGARNTAHLKKMLSINTFDLDDHDLGSIKQVITQAKGPKGSVFELERNRDGKHGSIMKYNLQKGTV